MGKLLTRFLILLVETILILNTLAAKVRAGIPMRMGYKYAVTHLNRTIKEMVDLRNKHILVIGSQKPWLEAYLIAK